MGIIELIKNEQWPIRAMMPETTLFKYRNNYTQIGRSPTLVWLRIVCGVTLASKKSTE